MHLHEEDVATQPSFTSAEWLGENLEKWAGIKDGPGLQFWASWIGVTMHKSVLCLDPPIELPECRFKLRLNQMDG